METVQFFMFDRQFGPQQEIARYPVGFKHPLPDVFTEPQAAALHLIFQRETSAQFKTNMKKQETKIGRMVVMTSASSAFKSEVADLKCQKHRCTG